MKLVKLITALFLLQNEYLFGLQIIERAEKIIHSVQEANATDLQNEFIFIKHWLQDEPIQKFSEMKTSAIKLLQQEKITLSAINLPKSNDDAPIAIKSSFVKLLGDAHHTGIFDDAINMISSFDSLGDLEEKIKRARQHDITVMKTALMFMRATNVADDPVMRMMFLLGPKICYPAFVRKLSDRSLNIASRSILHYPKELESNSGNHFYIPNAGYIFGGDFIEGECRGIDCSAFVSKCLDAKYRLTTAQFEEVWNTLHMQAKATNTIISEMISKFIAIKNEDAESLKAGDLVVWRDQVGSGGHIAIFKEWRDKTNRKFVGLESARAENKTREGVLVSELDVFKKGRNTFLLRYK